MKLSGSCLCERITFTLSSVTPYPSRICYCTRCRKLAGGTGGLAHIAGDAKTLRVDREEFLTRYVQAGKPRGEGKAPLVFHQYGCSRCFCHLYSECLEWEKWVYVTASAIDTSLPVPPEYQHVALAEKPDWVALPTGPEHSFFDNLPEESIEDWHKRHGLYESSRT